MRSGRIELTEGKRKKEKKKIVNKATKGKNVVRVSDKQRATKGGKGAGTIQDSRFVTTGKAPEEK